ncbi:hypothetical protein JR316_0001846 [Psilocybe cubensis]|uniref:Uncharacterized protein n=2 Tax=Psilocybe cubensis TaxID=181762 RepID=A0A8H7Y6Q5_PSICU|nr:hypothetical protein JR316_0001846 [Psilocybe cubensis]KAH9484942.1 hypothetical protein JR316_0001846 [Psilocybe cubensis]
MKTLSSLSAISGAESSHQGASREITTSQLPYELQREIFEIAATLNGISAFRLTEVSSFVSNWVRPILYQRIVLRNSRAGSCFLRAIGSKPTHFYNKLVKSLTLTEDVSMACLKPVLAELRNIISFTLFGVAYSQEMYNILNLIRSPHLRRMTLVYRHNSERTLTSHQAHEIPPKILTSLTHLTIVTDHPDRFLNSWDNLDSALSGNAATSVPNHLALFQHLTHFAVSFCRYTVVHRIMQAAPNLRYFVILLPANFIHAWKDGLLNFARLQLGVSVVILKNLGDTASWNVNDGFGPSNFWRWVERLVEDGYISDNGDIKGVQRHTWL